MLLCPSNSCTTFGCTPSGHPSLQTASHKTDHIQDMIEFCEKPPTGEQQAPPYPKASPCSNNVATPAGSGKKEHARTSKKHAMEAHGKHQQTTTKQWPRVQISPPFTLGIE